MSILGWIIIIVLYCAGAVLMAGFIYLDFSYFGWQIDKDEKVNLTNIMVIIFWFVGAYFLLWHLITEIIKNIRQKRDASEVRIRPLMF